MNKFQVRPCGSEKQIKVTKFDSTVYCSALLTMLQETTQDKITQSAQMQKYFFAHIKKQPAHIKQLLGTLHASEVNVDYWIDALNNGSVTIATDVSAADQKEYFATVFHTDNRTIWLQGS
eukprot:3349094-Ditylum_brightwellii.AAC.1